MTLVLRVGGVQDTLNAFRDLPRAIRNRHMRIAMNAGAGVIRDTAVANAPKQSGLLKKSLKVKVRVPDASYNVAHHGRPAYAVIGPVRHPATPTWLKRALANTTFARPLASCCQTATRCLARWSITQAQRLGRSLRKPLVLLARRRKPR
jgi:hypothetical protein